MPTKPAVTGFFAIPTTAIAGAGTTTSAWVNLRTMGKVAFQSEWTGTLNGTMSFEITNYPAAGGGQPGPNAKATALTLPASFAAGNPAGAAGDFVFEFVDMAEGWIRQKFTWVSGAGNLTSTVGAKS